MKVIQLIRYGEAEEAFKITETEKPEISKEEVLIKTETFGLNFADVMARRGLYKDAPPLPCVLGYEVVGRVVALGTNVTNLKEGQKVVAFTRFGGYAEYTKTKAAGVTVIPEELDNSSATALSTQYCTAYHAAYDMANIKNGETILIHVAAGGVGIALVQLAKLKGCIIIGTAGSEKKIKFLKDLGVDHTINYRENDFVDEIKKLPGNIKPDVIFDPVGGESFKKGKSILNYGGRIVTYGASDQLNRKKGLVSSLKLLFGFGFIHPVGLLMNSIGVLGVNMLRIADHKPEILKHALDEVVGMVERKEIRPYVGKEFKASEISEAHAFLENRKSIGKVVLHW
jgi:NADPH2:quinone reductase